MPARLGGRGDGLRSSAAVPSLVGSSVGASDPTRSDLRFDKADRRRLVLASALTVAVLPAVWLINRDEAATGRPNVAAVGLPAGGHPVDPDLGVAGRPDGHRRAALPVRGRPTADAAPPAVVAVGSSEDDLVATGDGHLPPRRRRHRHVPVQRGRRRRAGHGRQRRQRPLAASAAPAPASPTPRQTSWSCTPTPSAPSPTSPARRSTSRSASRWPDDALAADRARAAGRAAGWPPAATSGRTSSPTPTPSAASPTSPASGPATPWSRSAPASAR